MQKHRQITTFILFTLVSISTLILSCSDDSGQPIKVGILHSLTGTMAFSEKDLVDALTLAVEEINRSGGVLGQPLQPVIADGASNWDQFASKAKQLIVQDQVPVIFGCWTSASRKAVKPVVEQYQHLLFYPVQYEGLEQSPNIIYTGAAPNQQIIPSIHWALENLGQRVYLLGSDYIFPRAANMIIKDLLKKRGLTPLAEVYLPLGSNDVSSVIRDIRQLKPDLIFNTINGDSNIAFFTALNNLKPADNKSTSPEHDVTRPTVVSFSIGEPEVKTIGSKLLAGHYAAWNYFQSINSRENINFVHAFKSRFGQHRVINDPMESAYIGLYLWAQAVTAAGTTDPKSVKAVMAYQSFKAPQGVVSIDAPTQHLWKTVRIGRVLNDGQFKIVWSSKTPVRPAPFPSYYSKDQWRKRLALLTANE
ncbi:urea ABC transporter substrate-binding protein [Thalassomonas sp. RHCl1]|uniref:urea ABC transporter substrate-binding protein n=1 Tax=Thalassomonas sp. RHCl1 TaxID=2995320 RepID=UPI00248BA405|nr:urea ABC transporter substrate-binding protein [Thalassomonas sp. RHCl1]